MRNTATMAKAKTSAAAPSAPASQRENQGAPITPGAPIEKNESLTDLLRAELNDEPERSTDTETTTTTTTRPVRKTAVATEEGADTAAEDEAETEEGAEEVSTEGEETTETEDTETEGEETAEGEETEEQSEESETEEADAAADGEAPDLKGVSPGLRKRFKQLTDRVKAAEAERDQVKQQLSARPAAPAGSLEERVRRADTPEQLDQMQQNLEQWEEFALSNPEGAELPGKDGATITYSQEQIRGILIDVRRAMRAVPTQRGQLEAAKAQDAEARKAYPDYANPDSAVSKEYAALVAAHPSLPRLVPSLRLLVADAARGRALRAKSAPPVRPGKPIVRSGVPPVVTRVAPTRGQAPQSAQQKAQRLTAARARAEEHGGADAVADVLMAKFGG
jgi:hypothetical protein